MAGSGVLVVRADLHDPAHAAAWKACTQAYASDPMGGASPLTEELLQRSVVGLRDLPSSLVFLAFDGAAPAGMATCFRAWSTFAARPLINVHDLAVNAAYRGNGVGGALLRAVEAAARAEGCGKVTLEVLPANATARALYVKHGFVFDMLFGELKLDDTPKRQWPGT